MKHTITVITAIIALVILECFAINHGVNGILFTTVIGAICGLAGLVLPNPFRLGERGKK